MKNIETIISPFVESQFPSFYKEEGQDFIAFVQAYYEWMESTGQTIEGSRSLSAYRDVDTTIDDFVIHFKEKYLKDLPFITTTDKRFLVKHIQDLYRTRGTERGVNLLFRLLYNIDSSVYYPGDDLFKPSSGEWVVPDYIEVTPDTNNTRFLSQTIVGTISQSTAFVERVVRKRVQGKFIDVLFISNLSGKFVFNEHIVIQSNPVVNGAPKVIGSLTDLIVINGGQEFAKGDVLTVTNGSGQQGKALVTDISTETGRVAFNIEDGGFGYSSNAQVLVSQRNITFANPVNANTSISGFQLFETVKQPKASIVYSSSSNSAAFANGSIVENYYPNGAVSSNALILLNEPISNSSGTLTILPITGNVASDSTFSLRGNTTTGVISTYTDTSATGNVMYVSNTSLGVVSIINNFETYGGNYFYGLTSNTYANLTLTTTGTGATFSVGKLTNQETVLLFTDKLTAKNSGNVAFMDIILDGSNSNVSSNGYGFPKWTGGGPNATLQNILSFGNITVGTVYNLTKINPGEGYNADPYVLVLEPLIADLDKRDVTLKLSNEVGLFVSNEVVTMTANTTGIQFNVTGFTGTAANGSTTSAPEIGEAVLQSNGSANLIIGYVYQTNVVGGAGTITVANTTGACTVIVRTTLSTSTTNATANITSSSNVALQTTTQGLFKSGNTTSIKVRPLSIVNSFQAGQTLFGKLSGTVANIIDVAEDDTTLPLGENLIVTANVQVANTVVSKLQVLDAGFGYVNDENVSLTKPDSDYVVTARTVLLENGFSEGYYKSQKGFLDADSKIYDGNYYQDYSYEVRTRAPLGKYASVLKNVMHAAGTKYFGKVILDSINDYEGANLIVPGHRHYEVSLANGVGTFVLGETVNTNTGASGTLEYQSATITSANLSLHYTVGTQISSPSFSANTRSGIIQATTTSNGTITLYLTNIKGTMDTSNTAEIITGKVIGISNVHQGNTVTGSYAVGETVYQGANTDSGITGTVIAANNTQITIKPYYGGWSSNTTIYGVTSNAYSTAGAVTNYTNTFTIQSAINTLYIANATSQFVGNRVVGLTSNASANAIYTNVVLDT